MYKVREWYDSGFKIYSCNNEVSLKETMKKYRNSHLDIYINGKYILEVRTLLPKRLIDKLDFDYISKQKCPVLIEGTPV
ncbi:hypothetical protein [Metabacillus arenae]|uniref:Uncharacterized protein n=1 Tax=Metabacillus arenae TaxID=2771434 RepID=A0A926RZH3_9BACI|nr:hypothetical protein [Metabacillus arenae]MBD1379054.1 hypothetical protein [Metabacillus arenae]